MVARGPGAPPAPVSGLEWRSREVSAREVDVEPLNGSNAAPHRGHAPPVSPDWASPSYTRARQRPDCRTAPLRDQRP